MFLGAVISKVGSVKELKKEIEDILRNVEKYVFFVQEKDDIKECCDKIKTRIYAHHPPNFIIFSKHSAMPKSLEIMRQIKETISDYRVEEHSSGRGDKIYFLIKEDEIET